MPPSAVVIDTSALLDYVLGAPNAIHLEPLLAEPLFQLHAPEILDQEVLSVVKRLERAGELTEERAEEVLRDAAGFLIELHPLRPHVERVWSLRHNVWVSDAFYISLAESLDAGLLTTDKKLVRLITAERGIGVGVITP